MLRQLGVTAATVIANRDGTGTPLEQQTAAPRAAGLRWYVENIATDFYASYHRYTPGRPVNWRFLAAQERYSADPSDVTALRREPSLLDETWRGRIRDRLTATVKQQKPFQPLYYSLADEAGIADLGAFWDFDFSAPSVSGFRAWLREQYGTLAALNAEWGTDYADWSSIEPEPTREEMRREGDNFARWNDFKAWMDASFAESLRFGTDAIHRADPNALSAIEGVQTPGWGGYDYAQLARAVDVMEVYDGDQNLPLIRSINPRVIPLITSFGGGRDELHGIWRSVLRGARGLVLWDEDNSIVRADASPGPRAAPYAPMFAALRGEVGRALVDAQPVYDSVAVLYSPVSFRVNWIQEHRHESDAWLRWTADTEPKDTAWRVSLRAYSDALARMGLHPRFITQEELSRGKLSEAALILPHSIALADPERRAISAFAAKGGLVIADTPPGQFDGHGRRQIGPALPVTIVAPANLASVLNLPPLMRIDTPQHDIDTYVLQSRGRRLLALQQRTAGAAPVIVEVALHGARARDIATGHDYGRQDRLVLTVDPIVPTVLQIGERRGAGR